MVKKIIKGKTRDILMIINKRGNFETKIKINNNMANRPKEYISVVKSRVTISTINTNSTNNLSRMSQLWIGDFRCEYFSQNCICSII